MKRYRFYDILPHGFDEQKVYFTQDRQPTTERKEAGLFTEADWLQWGEGLRREEIGEDEAMRLAGAPMLPGMEG